MAEFVIKVASQPVKVRAIYDSSKEYCKAYLCDEAPAFTVQISVDDLTLERRKCERTDLAEGVPVRNLSDSQLEITAIQRKIAEKLFEFDTVLFHGSAVAVDGEAYLFTAKSGTGKSTHTRLWRQLLGERAIMINDDKPFLHVTNEGIFAYGSPWNGKHRLGTNICVPLKAICILERGEGNKISRISGGEALFMLLQQSNRPAAPNMLEKYMELIDEITRKVAFYRLQCNMDLAAAELSFSSMSAE